MALVSVHVHMWIIGRAFPEKNATGQQLQLVRCRMSPLYSDIELRDFWILSV